MTLAPRILVVDDEPVILSVLKDRLTAEGFEVLQAADGEEALRLEASQPLDLIILDLMLPKVDGYEVCRRIKDHSTVPIIILSARGDELDKVVGFRMGVDDYLTKPFSPSELVWRVRAILRRWQKQEGQTERKKGPLVVGNIFIDPEKRLVMVGGQTVYLTAREFEVLFHLAAHPGMVFTREQILALLGEEGSAEERKNVTSLMSRLREKIEADPGRPAHLKTVWGVGYKLDP